MESVYDKRILLVDDEPDITELVETALRKEGFRCIDKAFTGSEALAACENNAPDVVILDIMLPDMDGIQVCRTIRGFSYCPVLFLSARNDDVDKILGLSSGGDDYITKPFSPKELVFRVKAQLRRLEYNQTADKAAGRRICAGGLEIDVDGSRVYQHGRELELTAREFGILLYLAENAGKIISKERLYEQVWGELSAVCDNTIMVHIRHLREKVEADPSRPTLILTVKGLGYRLASGTGQ
ncbi:response regulator transcription factor [Eubacterium sp. 1001713B170207_170306_E7]|uniref:response regulator transcription factor n=1 Tax=Eubacterium sp. 1001713B170207_170306_E7 TaxID=2787097 RepID=UPI001899A080|nr:response regulator transcription factor [Eubacterium sp. 1001713B170207_170306_E7]